MRPGADAGRGEPETARTELLSGDAILFLERVNDVTLLRVDPARDGHDEELPHVGNTATYGASRAEALGGHERRDPASVQRSISPSDGVDRVLGQYGDLLTWINESIYPNFWITLVQCLTKNPIKAGFILTLLFGADFA